MTDLPRMNKSLYDFAASLLSKLKCISSTHFYREKEVDSLPSPANMDTDIGNIIKQVRHYASTQGRSLSRQLVRYNLPDFFIEWFDRWELNNDFKSIYTLLCKLSRAIDISDLVFYVSRYPGLEALNHNVESTGIIVLPRLPAINQPITSDEIITHDNGLPSEDEPFSWADTRKHLQINNLYYTEPRLLSTSSGRKFKIENYIIERGSPRTSLDKLRVAVCPIAKGAFLSVKLESSPEPTTGHVFEITGLKRKNYIRGRVKAAYLAACQSRADILLFPEMLGEEVTFQREFWDSLCALADEAGYKKSPG